MVVLVCLNELFCLSFVKSELLKEVQNVLIDRNVGDTSSLVKDVDRHFDLVEPRMLSYIFCFVSLLWVSVQNAFHKFSAFLTHKLWNEEIPTQDLLI